MNRGRSHVIYHMEPPQQAPGTGTPDLFKLVYLGIDPPSLTPDPPGHFQVCSLSLQLKDFTLLIRFCPFQYRWLTRLTHHRVRGRPMTWGPGRLPTHLAAQTAAMELKAQSSHSPPSTCNSIYVKILTMLQV